MCIRDRNNPFGDFVNPDAELDDWDFSSSSNTAWGFLAPNNPFGEFEVSNVNPDVDLDDLDFSSSSNTVWGFIAPNNPFAEFEDVKLDLKGDVSNLPPNEKPAVELVDIVSIFVAVSDDEGFEELPNEKPAVEFVDVASIFVAVLDDEGFEELPNEKPAVEFSDVKSNLKDNSFPSALNFISFCW